MAAIPSDYTGLSSEVSELKSALTFKADKKYGGTTTDSAVSLTGGKTWVPSYGTIVDTSNRACSEPIPIIPNMKSITPLNGYKVVLYGNDDGPNHALTAITGWVSTAQTIVGNINYKYLYVVAQNSTNTDITGTVTNAVSIAYYDSVLPFALDGDLDALAAETSNIKDDLTVAEESTGILHLNLHADNIINSTVNATTGQPTYNSDTTRACTKQLFPVMPNVPIYYTRPASGYFNPYIYYFKNGTFQGYDSSFTSGKSYDADAVRFLFFKNPTTDTITPQNVVDSYKIWQETSTSYNKRITALENDVFGDPYITCWGDSLTSMAGWTQELGTLTGMTIRNAGIGGEGIDQIRARQGADAYIVKGITIPADTSAVTLTTNAEGFNTQLGVTGIKPNFTGNLIAHFNPCKIAGVEGTITRNGTGSSDTITFARKTAGSAVTLSRPETIKTNADMNWNAPYLMIIWMGQNSFGYDNDNEITGTISAANISHCIESARLMIEHAKATNFLVLGIATGTAASNADYEAALAKEFGRYFFSVRQYLVHPVYSNGSISTCYGLQDIEATPTAQDLTDIANGKVPSQCFMDGVHFVEALRPFIGDAIYKRCKELNMF